MLLKVLLLPHSSRVTAQWAGEQLSGEVLTQHIQALDEICSQHTQSHDPGSCGDRREAKESLESSKRPEESREASLTLS